MKHLFLVILTLCCSIAVSGQVVGLTKGRPAAARSSMTVTVDSVDFRTDLTRVYCHVNGRPHTAQRIDRVMLEAPGVSVAANDIDGVDFERYFQWEDEGVINLELDFAPLPKLDQITLKMTTIYGPVSSAQTPILNGKAVK